VDLAVQVVDEPPWTVVAVGGDLDMTTAPRLRERLIRLVGDGRRHLVVDLGGVGFLDSTGLGVLVGALRRTRALDGDVVLTGLDGTRAELFAITGLDRAFSIHPTVADAVAVGVEP